MLDTNTVNAINREIDRATHLKTIGKFRYTVSDNAVSDLFRLAVLMEEVGEAAQLVNKRDYSVETIDHYVIYHSKLQEELIQVAAVAAAWVQQLRTRTRINDARQG